MAIQSRRSFLRNVAATTASLATSAAMSRPGRAGAKRPNVLIFITDDQGWGDLGCHGNNYIRTPNIDSFARESVEFTQFHVCPVCAPTRASLMTGRYNFRTRVVDTWMGRAMMDSDEYTLAEALVSNGYRTGIFGKWHLGDNYPMRTIDQGFEESIVHHGGGLAQPSGPTDNHYFDPILLHNGKEEKFDGYCMDIYADKAIEFMTEHRDEPFFVYLATNTPHDPLEVADEYADTYRSMGLNDRHSRVYGMVENIDDNMGKVLAALDDLELSRDTIVIFMSDNGPWMAGGRRYNGGMRGAKGTVYDGGIKTPFLIRWPSRFIGNRNIDHIAAHIDIMPTILDACGIATDGKPSMDGRSLMPLLTTDDEIWPDRTLYFQWHRGDVPQLYRCFSARNQRYKLVQTSNGPHSEEQHPSDMFHFELFDMLSDPEEKHNIASVHPDIVSRMKREYAAWFKDVSSERGFGTPRIHLGTPFENPSTLTRQDWRGNSGWSDRGIGDWEVFIADDGPYDITLRLSEKITAEDAVTFKFGDLKQSKPVRPGAISYTFENIRLPIGEGTLEAWTQWEGKKVGVKYVDVHLRN